jgi:hypothetical protein
VNLSRISYFSELNKTTMKNRSRRFATGVLPDKQVYFDFHGCEGLKNII